MDGVASTFSAHNILLPDGTETLRGRELVADNGICRAALRDLALAFPDPAAAPRVADLGCLEGGYSAAFARAGYDVTGFEVRTENFLCCEYVRKQLDLPNLAFSKTDVRDIFTGLVEWDAVFCCGLLYHLDNPVAFLRELGKATRKLLILQTHYSTRPDAEHEGCRGHWYTEGKARWASWKNPRSFWLAKDDLLKAMHDAGFGLVLEQADFRYSGRPPDLSGPDERGMFVGVKL